MACIGMIMINNWNEEIDGNSQILNHCFFSPPFKNNELKKK